MSTNTAFAEPVTANGDPDVHHFVCCDENIAMCGEDVTTHEWSDGEDGTVCPLCAWVDDACLPCPVPGCDPVREPAR